MNYICQIWKKTSTFRTNNLKSVIWFNPSVFITFRSRRESRVKFERRTKAGCNSWRQYWLTFRGKWKGMEQSSWPAKL